MKSEVQHYSLILVSDETSPVRRFDVRRSTVKRAIWGAAAVAAVLLLAFVDYVLVRIDHVDLEGLRIETVEQQARIDSFDETLAGVQASLDLVREFERKVRTIANLPGSVATGGAGVVEVGSAETGDLATQARGFGDAEAVPGNGAAQAPRLPQGAKAGEAADEPRVDHKAEARVNHKVNALAADDRVSALRSEARQLAFRADERLLSLQELVGQLESKHAKLASSPAIWPTQGWLTSRFGTRISPFTGRRQFHAGIDIAGARGTDVVATARGKVTYAGSKGPLGKTVIIDHGHGIRTHYGHNSDVYVKRGQQVERGQRIASLGNTGRSTGPHIHYSVEVKGKAVNPLDYIFD